jgi:HPr kinase/phosphorylase
MTIYDPPSGDARGISVRALLADPELTLKVDLVAGSRGLDREIKHARIQKSGLALIGHGHGLVQARVQILGETELSYVETLTEEQQRTAAQHLFSLRPACVIVTRGVQVSRALIEAADATETPLIVCEERTSAAIATLHNLLDERLAPRTRIHGVLVDVFEVGVLLLGKSGIGKSEAALELVMRGHRLVADDVIECDYRPPGLVFGEPAPLLRYQIEVRGLGILDIKDLYGVTAIRERKRLDLVVRLEEASADHGVDRIGIELRTREILAVPIREVILPVRPGRNMSSIIEIAARNELLRQAGRDSARDFVERIDRELTPRRAIGEGLSPGDSGSMPAVRHHSVPHMPVPGVPAAAPNPRTSYESSAPPPVTRKSKP